MRLTDNEIRDITRLLEQGNPLPDQYRFLLFGIVMYGRSRKCKEY